MQLEYLKTANSLVMWISVIPPILLVIYQSVIFARRAIDTGKKMGITGDQIKTAAQSSLVASIGPSIVIVIGMVGLLASLGGPVAWMRLAYIGSVAYELPAADRAATAAGATLGTANMTAAAFANAVWVMTACSLGWLVVSALFTDKVGIVRDKIAAGSGAVLAIIATSGGIGGMAYQAFDRAIPKFSDQTATVIAAAIFMYILEMYARKSNKLWAKQFGLTIAMIGGVLVGSMFM